MDINEICENEYKKLVTEIEPKVIVINGMLKKHKVKLTEKMKDFTTALAYLINDFTTDKTAVEFFKFSLNLNEFATKVILSLLPPILSCVVKGVELDEEKVVDISKQYERFLKSPCYIDPQKAFENDEEAQKRLAELLKKCQ